MLSTLVSLWVAASFAAGASDPLLTKMEGRWKGEGERVQYASGRRVRIEAETDSRGQVDRLVSVNRIREISAGETREYVRKYWVRPRESSPGTYELGYGSGEGEVVSSLGRFEGGKLSVEQNLGGEPPYLIRSRTEFLSDGSVIYVENAWHGTTPLSETQIRYRLEPREGT